MTTAQLFQEFRNNLTVKNADAISTAYANITMRLNKDFRDLESDVLYRRQIGSYGRRTAIHGISDLDMAIELPWSLYEKYKAYQNNGPSQLLQAVRESLKKRYPKTEIKGDGQVVVIKFSGFVVEVLPAFVDKDADGYRFPDANNGGSWRVCKPIQEMDAVEKRNGETSRNYKQVCKMTRAWKNNHGVSMTGMLIDTLVYNFFGQHKEFNSATYSSYDKLMATFFAYLGGLDHQDYWAAPGSGQRVHSKGKFQTKAKKAATKCQEAVDEASMTKKSKLWQDVFGRSFPLHQVQLEKAMASDSINIEHVPGEQFIEDMYPVDVSYDLAIDCEVKAVGLLKRMLAGAQLISRGRDLRFHIEACDVPHPYDVMWKVRNVGAEAQRRKMLRGQIVSDRGGHSLVESTTFGGDHYVEVYIIKDGVCVARDVIDVPIQM